MQPHDYSMLDAPTCVRRFTGSTAMTAALLILFGYFFFDSDLTSVSGETSIFIIAWQIFIHTLRIGGLLLVIIAIFISVGFPLALLGNAIATAAIGSLLVVSCVLFMASDGFGLDYLICGICGLSLLTSGFRCWNDYAALPAQTMVDSIEGIDSYSDVGDELEETSSTPRSPVAKNTTSCDKQTSEEPVHFDKPTPHKYRTKSSKFEPGDTINLDNLSPDDTPPDGFLADFGKKK